MSNKFCEIPYFSCFFQKKENFHDPAHKTQVVFYEMF